MLRLYRVHRVTKGALIAGVNTGLADLLDCSPWLLRLGWILALLINLKLAVIAYLIMAFILPKQSAKSAGSVESSRLETLEEEYRALRQRLKRA